LPNGSYLCVGAPSYYGYESLELVNTAEPRTTLSGALPQHTIEWALPMILSKDRYQHSPKALAFLATVRNGKYQREIISGSGRVIDGCVPADMRSLYTPEQLQHLIELRGTPITRHYFNLAGNSKALQALVKAGAQETADLGGTLDRSKQMNYRSVEGLIHKYELGLIYVAMTRRGRRSEEPIAPEETDDAIAPRDLATMAGVAAYIARHNSDVAQNGGLHPTSRREKLREILMSGGEPMALTNKNLAQWWSALADAGIESIRVDTREAALYPQRFDDTFFDMLDKFHAAYPGTRLRLMMHFNHPDEFLKKDASGRYIDDPQGGLQWLAATRRAIEGLGQRAWLTLDNQAPIIDGINDDPNALRIMQRELRRNRVENHYFFCGRDSVGHKACNIPIERVWQLLNESQKGLSGVEAHARLSITHDKGKTEVAAVSNQPLAGVPGTEKGFVVFKLMRSVEDARDRGKVTIVGRNPDAVGFDGYNDRVIYDEAGLYADAEAAEPERFAANTVRLQRHG